MSGAGEPVVVAALQMTSSPEVEANLAAARGLLEQAAGEGAALAVLPENFSFMGLRERDRLAVAEVPGDGPAQAFLAQSARELGLWIVGGTVPLAGGEGGRVNAACLVYAADGGLRARYDKIHLFDVRLPGSDESYEESATIAPGDEPVLVDTPAGRVGLSVCYDLRFAELYRRLAAEGAALFTVPSAFTEETGRAHWETLVRARAIENQAFVIAPGQCGRHASGRRTHGHSMIVDPWGRILAQRSEDAPGLVAAALDPALLADVRERFPALRHRRL